MRVHGGLAAATLTDFTAYVTSPNVAQGGGVGGLAGWPPRQGCSGQCYASPCSGLGIILTVDDGEVPDGERSREMRHNVTALGDRDSLKALKHEYFQGYSVRGNWTRSPGHACRALDVGQGSDRLWQMAREPMRTLNLGIQFESCVL